MEQHSLAIQIIESLRKGIPPQLGTDLYSVGNEKLIQGIETYHLSGIHERGIIRFMSGSWGAGKTHFFRLLREVAFKNGCLVSNVELNVNDAALNKFERVFSSIVRNVVSSTHYSERAASDAAPFGRVIQECLFYLATGTRKTSNEITYDDYSKAREILMDDRSLDIDFKKIVDAYWKTFLPESAEPAIQEQTREEIVQWFSGEGTIGGYRKRFGVNKVVARENAKLMLQSLAGFVRASGHRGLLILFDEAEQSYSIMRKSALKDAHNNLKSLIDNIETLPGLFLLYATTPDFFSDPKHGIVVYGALAGRIGKPESRQPRALDTIWNFDAVETNLSDYQSSARKIRAVYATGYPHVVTNLPTEEETDLFVANLFRSHPSLAAVRFWRVLVTAVTAHFDDHLEGEVRPTETVYRDVMERLREE